MASAKGVADPVEESGLAWSRRVRLVDRAKHLRSHGIDKSGASPGAHVAGIIVFRNGDRQDVAEVIHLR
jgi:hypothetical protein